MFTIGTVPPTPGKMEARKEVRMHRADEERIKAAAAATGLQEADFIRQAALLRAQEVEQRMSLSILPIEAFDAFKAAVKTQGKIVPGLAQAAQASKGLLKDAR
ncbi:type II toxin -antitoxin system TacA 1-like antitoxin [Pseudogemmobacter sp. W21_MBD1_M6]|uniref:type II toxin -antitoxin system TacA 1-like antitoxin n=1 Tax=Pseudogemmobacter sp. W21_MBD1_M6 TaxID=3240271 RepID=UPI003F9C568E